MQEPFHIDYAELEQRVMRGLLQHTRQPSRRRFGVWLVLKLWPIMPRRARVWAFLNDEVAP